jgi:4'-phosphopantetheinyl transferase
MFRIGPWGTDLPVSVGLTPRVLHLWSISLEAVGGDLPNLLSADERERALRFRQEADRRRFVAARSALRSILAHYLACPPADVVFRYNRHGKPGLAEPRDGLEFNLSHAGDRALLALSRDLPLGVDLEPLPGRRGRAALAERVFGRPFAEALDRLPEAERELRFLKAWTALEARCKALGTGVFARQAVSATLPVFHFEPAENWLAALSSPLPLPPVEAWYCFAWPGAEPPR